MRISLLFVAGFALVVAMNASGQAHTTESDLTNLESSVSAGHVQAYNLASVRAAWDAANEKIAQKGVPLSSVRVGVVDTGIEQFHTEFDGIQIGALHSRDLIDPQYIINVENDAGERCLKIIPGHGTAVAGIIGANNLSDSGEYTEPHMNGVLSGVLQESQYSFESRSIQAPLELENIPTTDFDGRFLVGNVVRSGSQVVNISFSTTSFGFAPNDPCTTGAETFSRGAEAWVDMFKTFQEHSNPEFRKVVFVTSAGNSGVPALGATPANATLVDSIFQNGLELNNVITVGAIDLDSTRAIFRRDDSGNEEAGSNFGPGVHIAAPGTNVYAPKRQGLGNFPTSGQLAEAYTTEFGGTSAAAPFVTGVVGLLKAIQPDLMPKQIRDILIETADPIFEDDPAERAKKLGPVDPAVDPVHCNPSNLPNARGCRLNAHAAVCHEDVLDCSGGEPEGYDYASDFIRVVGNIPAVPGCTASGDIRFVDNFDDNAVDTGCTGTFSKVGTFTESGGYIHYTRQGAVVTTFTGDTGVFEIAEHRLSLASTMSDGGGDATFTVAFRPDPPTGSRTGQPFTSYGIFFGGSGTSLTLQVYDNIPEGPGEPGGPTVAAFSAAGSSFAPLSFPTPGPLLLRVAFSDVTNAFSVAFSTTGGATYQTLLGNIPFSSSGPVFLSTFAFQEDPTTTLTATTLPQALSSDPAFGILPGMRTTMLPGHNGAPAIPVLIPQ